jgi:hypothetical protein
MTRIFTTLATLLASALIVSFVLGVASQMSPSAAGSGDSLYLMHFRIGLLTALGALLVHCLIFTYFLGTGRWVKEVGIAYKLPDKPLPFVTRELKRKTFPPALAAMLVTIACAAAGAGLQHKEWPWLIHGGLAVAALLVNFWAFRLEYRNVKRNAKVIEDVLNEVDKIRAARGLPSNAEALHQHEP